MYNTLSHAFQGGGGVLTDAIYVLFQLIADARNNERLSFTLYDPTARVLPSTFLCSHAQERALAKPHDAPASASLQTANAFASIPPWPACCCLLVCRLCCRSETLQGYLLCLGTPEAAVNAQASGWVGATKMKRYSTVFQYAVPKRPTTGVLQNVQSPIPNKCYADNYSSGSSSQIDRVRSSHVGTYSSSKTRFTNNRGTLPLRAYCSESCCGTTQTCHCCCSSIFN